MLQMVPSMHVIKNSRTCDDPFTHGHAPLTGNCGIGGGGGGGEWFVQQPVQVPLLVLLLAQPKMLSRCRASVHSMSRKVLHGKKPQYSSQPTWMGQSGGAGGGGMGGGEMIRDGYRTKL